MKFTPIHSFSFVKQYYPGEPKDRPRHAFQDLLGHRFKVPKRLSNEVIMEIRILEAERYRLSTNPQRADTDQTKPE